MLRRKLTLNKSNNLLLLGPRGSGKSTLINQQFLDENVLWIDLLSEEGEDRFGKHPGHLSEILAQKTYDFVVIDEIQKFPKLLDIVHKEIENRQHQTKFILSGSSARKLKRGQANLTAGRLFIRELYPFTSQELGEHFELGDCLELGVASSYLRIKISRR